MNDVAYGPLSRVMQRHILAALIHDSTLLSRVRGALDPAYFADEATSDIVAYVLNQWDNHKQIPSKAVLLDAFSRGEHSESRKHIIKKAFLSKVTDDRITAERIVSFAQQRAMHKAIRRAAEILKARDEGHPLLDAKGRPVKDDPVELVRNAALVGADNGDIGQFFHEQVDSIIERTLHPEEREKFTTGQTHLDESGMMLERGEVGCVLARAKGGKSQWLLGIAYANIRAARNVIYYNIEIPKDRLEDRWARRVAGRRADVKTDPVAFCEMLRKKADKIKGKLLLKKYISKQVTFDAIHAHTEQCIAAGFRPDLVILDYAGLMKPRHVYDDMRFNLASLWLDFRAYCQEYNVAGWSAAQTNRSGADAELVTMTSIAESFEIVQHIDAGFSLNMTDEEYANGQGRAFVFASRNEKDNTLIQYEHDYARSIIRTTGLVAAEDRPKKGRKPSNAEQAEQAAFERAKLKDKEKEQRVDHPT